MDNNHIEVISEGKENFQLALDLAFNKAPGKRCNGYKLSNNTMQLFWVKREGITEFPYDMNSFQAAEFFWNWLSQVKYGEKPDMDGDSDKGFRVYNDHWGQAGESGAFLWIKPIWALYGK